MASEVTDREIDERRLRIEARLSQLRQQSAPEALLTLRRTLQETATPQELDEWERLTTRLTGILEDHATTLFRFGNTRKTTRSKIEALTSWEGFSAKPPYSITLVDSLSDSLDSKNNVLKSLDLFRTTIDAELEESSSSLKTSSKRVRLAEEAVEKEVGQTGEQRSRWLLQLAQLDNEVNQADVLFGETRRLYLAASQRGIQADIDLLRRQLAVAKKNFRFSDQELSQKLQAIDEQVATVRKSLAEAKAGEQKARRKLDETEAAIVRAHAMESTGRRPVPTMDQLHAEQKRRQIQFDDASLRSLVISGMLQLLKSEKALWEERHRIAGGLGVDGGQNGSAATGKELDLIAKWKEYLTNKLGVTEVLIKEQQDAPAVEARAMDAREESRSLLALYRDQEALLQRSILLVSNYEKLVQRRNEEADQARKHVPMVGRAGRLLAAAATLAATVWNTELYVAEETIIADDRKIIRPRSITVGKAVVALAILVAGIVAIRHLRRPLLWLATHRFALGDNDAQLYTRLLTYLMFITLLVSALVFVNIPLAVFTFLGGALAIGVGFGAQALINNFISGLILMFDRTIRMGDMVEVDGHRGRVASIGMRSSSIKRFDGVEMLVPNSLFLQQNVINWTSSDPRSRYSISVGVAYGSPTREVDRIIRRAVEEQPEVLRDPPLYAPYVVFDNFADSALIFTAYFWIEQHPEMNSLVVFSDIRHRICSRLAEAGISIPFPQRDLHLGTATPLEVRVVPSG